MANDFNPYYTWLGIGLDEQPADHYRLLGTKKFEPNPDVISNAADQRMAFLRTVQAGQHAALGQKLLNEISAARVCLLDPQKKAAYDLALKQKLSKKAKLAVAKPIEEVLDLANIPLDELLGNGTCQGPVAPQPSSAASSLTPTFTPKPTGPGFTTMPVKAAPKAQPPIKIWIAVGGGVAACLLLIVGVVMLAAPAKKVAVGSGTKSDTKSAVDTTSVEANSSPPQSVPIPAVPPPPEPAPTEPMPTVPIPAVPMPTNPTPSVPTTPVSPPSEPIANTSTPTITTPTLPTTSVPPTPTETPPSTSLSAPKASETEPATAGKPEPPDNEFRAETRKQLRKLFKQEFADAKQPNDKQALAQQLIRAAKDSQDDPKTRYVLLEEALVLFTDAADQAGAFSVVESLDDEFAIDPWKMKLTVATKIGDAAKLLPERKRQVDAMLNLIDDAIAAGRYDVAADAAQAANTITARITDADLRKRVVQRKKEVDELKKQVELAELARARLKTQPDNQRANVALGRFLCFTRGEWEEGLPLLAKGDDEKLKDAAAKELAKPMEGGALEELANAWFALGTAGNAVEKPAMLEHAKEIYTTAARDLTALAKVRVEKRIGDIEKLLQGSPTPTTPKIVRKPKTSTVAKNTPNQPNTVPRGRSDNSGNNNVINNNPNTNSPVLISNQPDDPNAVAALRNWNIGSSGQFGAVSVVDISLSNFSAADLKTIIEILKGFPNLYSVNFLHGPFPDGTIKTLAASAPNVRKIRVSTTRMLDAEMPEFAKFKLLETLEIFGNSNINSPFRFLGSLKNLKELKTLGIRASEADLEAIASVRTLKTLEFSATPNFGGYLKYVSGLTELEVLGVTGESDPAALHHVKNLKKLRSINIPRGCTDADFAHLKDLTNLERLELTNTSITDAGLAQLKNYPRLTYLYLPAGISDVGVRHLATLSNLTYLNLKSTSITNQELKILRNMTGLNSVTFPDSVTDLSPLANLPGLSSLDVSGAAINNDGLAVLKGHPRLSHIRFRGPQTLGTGLKYVKTFPAIQMLDFDMVNDLDEAFKSLGAINSLRIVNLVNRSQLTDAGLMQLQACPNLQSVFAAQVGITADGAAKLQKVLPNCKITK